MIVIDLSTGTPGSSTRHAIEKDEVSLGKDSGCDVVLKSPKVSRRHAVVFRRDGALYARDLGSTNGTSVNGVRLEGERRLESTDEIRILDFVIRVLGTEDTESDSARGGEGSEESRKADMFWVSMESFLGPIWPYVSDPGVSEIMVNGPREIFFEHKGHLTRAPASFTEEGLRASILNIAQYVGKRVDEDNPYMDARLPDGSRVAVVLPPCSRKGPCIAIRKFSKEKLRVEDLVTFGSLSPEMVAFIDVAVKLQKNVVISGGTSSGKTSLLNVVSSLIPDDQRIIVIEDSAELQLQQEHVLPLEAKPPDKHGRGEVTLRDLVRASLRLRPDRIVVGEVRGGEALDLLQAMNTGHSGSMATTHASSPLQTLSRLETLTLFSGLDLPILAIREQVSTAINLIVQAARFPDGSRKVTHVSEVMPLTPDGKYQVNDIYRYVRLGSEEGKILGEHRVVGHLPTFLDEIALAGLELPAGLAALAEDSEARAAAVASRGAH